jgi:hypothetical protein
MIPFFGYGEAISSSAAVKSSFNKVKNVSSMYNYRLILKHFWKHMFYLCVGHHYKNQQKVFHLM